jgi:4-amino-4-deoxy-L-arabinose transferase-like glycosyltransferase
MTHRLAIWTHVAPLLLIALAAVGLRVRHLDRDSLWYDEVVTMRLARSADFTELIAQLDQIDGTRAPFHPLLLRQWVRIFGPSELAGRSFSVVCGLSTVLMVYVLARRLYDEATGRWAAWLTAVCPPLVYYSQEARMYALLVLATCSSWLFLLDLRLPREWPVKALYAGVLVSLAYIHPLGLFMIAAHGVAYLLVRRSLALDLRSWLLVQVGVVLAILPWLPRYLDHGTDYPLPRYGLRYLAAVPIEYVGGNGLVLFLCVFIIAAGMSLWKARAEARLDSTLLLLAWLIVPPLAMFTYSWIGRPIFGPPRYHLFIAPAYLILLARGLAAFPPPFRWAFAAVGLVLSLSLIEANVYSQVAKADWRGLARWVAARPATDASAPPAFLVVVHPSDPRFPRDQIEAARYYLEPTVTVLPGGKPETEERVRGEAARGATVLEVRCLSVGEARRPQAISPATRSADVPPPLYGLDIRRP